MINLFTKTTNTLEDLFTNLERKIQPPVRKPYAGHFVYRYEEKTIEVALIQKLARVVTGLRASIVLLEAGFFQEVAALQRVLDDLNEEVTFLVTGKMTGTFGETHEKYLKSFFTETFTDPLNPDTALEVGRKPVSRKEIRKAIGASIGVMQSQGAPIDDGFTKNTRIVSAVFNGFVHAGSPQILEMYGGEPPHYHLRGMLNTPRKDDTVQSLWNQFFRASLTFAYVSLYFGEPKSAEAANSASAELTKNKSW